MQRKRHGTYPNVFGLAVCQHLCVILAYAQRVNRRTAYPEAISDAPQPVLGPPGGELDDRLRLFRRDLLSHDLTLRDLAELERKQSAVADLIRPSALYAAFDAQDAYLNAKQVWILETTIVRLLEIVGDGYGAAFAQLE